MVVIALELVWLVTFSSGILYVLQELIKPMNGFVNYIRSSVRFHLKTWNSAMIRSPKWSCLRKGGLVTWSWLWTWLSCQMLVCRWAAKSSGSVSVDQDVITVRDFLSLCNLPAQGGQSVGNWYLQHMELRTKLLDYFLRSNKSNINQSWQVLSLWVSVAGGDWCCLVVKLENYALALAAPLAQAYSFSILPAYMFILHQRKGCNPPKQEVHPCLTRFTTVVIHPVHYIHYKRVQTLTSLCWKPEGTICIIHHMFSTCFETHASWVLAYRAHQSPLSYVQKYTVLQPISLTCWGPDEILENLLRMICSCAKLCGTPAMGFSVRITETETGNSLFPKWCPLRNREQKQKQLMGLAAPRGRRRPKLRPQKKNWDVVAHRRACLLEFWIKFSRVSSNQKTCFQTQKCWRFDKFGSQIFDKCMCPVCHDVCGVRGEDWQVGHSEDKSNCRFELTLYSSSFSSLSCALSIPNSNSSLATCG